MSVLVADAEKTDVQALIAIYSSPHLYHNCEEASWFVKSYFDYHHVKVAKNPEKAVGALFWNVAEERHHELAEIRDLWVDEGFRKRGFGEKLLRAAIDDMERFFRNGGNVLGKVMVTTGEDNGPARKLYEKVGFAKVAVLADLFAKGENELVYVLTLSQN
jgi:ribosomal protein S18 acetylase RimI-like enzyme